MTTSVTPEVKGTSPNVHAQEGSLGVRSRGVTIPQFVLIISHGPPCYDPSWLKFVHTCWRGPWTRSDVGKEARWLAREEQRPSLLYFPSLGRASGCKMESTGWSNSVGEGHRRVFTVTFLKTGEFLKVSEKKQDLVSKEQFHYSLFFNENSRGIHIKMWKSFQVLMHSNALNLCKSLVYSNSWPFVTRSIVSRCSLNISLIFWFFAFQSTYFLTLRKLI